MRLGIRVLAGVVGVALVGWTATGWAQEEATETTAAAAVPAAPEDEWNRGTPHDSLLGFLEAGREGDWERAAKHLHLGPVPRSQRATRVRAALRTSISTMRSHGGGVMGAAGGAGGSGRAQAIPPRARAAATSFTAPFVGASIAV